SVGLVTAYLASQVRRLAISAQNREQQTARLYAFSQDLAIATDVQTITDNLLSHTTQTLDCELALFLPEQNTLHLQQTSATFYINQQEQEAATWAYQQGQQAGKGTKLASDALGLYRPMRVAKQILGVIGIQADAPLSADQERLLDAFVSQYALALEAIQLAQKAQKAELLSAKEKLQQTILNSVSHDLRTPLVSVKGALSSLIQDGDTLTDAMQHELLSGAFEETDRLNRLLGNLLDMSRLQSGAMILKREPYAIAEVISVARTQLQSRLKNHTVQVRLAENLPLIQIDLVLFAQVFVNLLDNAVKYSPPATTIQIEALLNDRDVILRVMDEGRGIPEPELAHIFDKFYRASTANSAGGSGLGLSIVQGIVELHDSSITAQNCSDGGTIFTITVPESQTLVI
ncbi:MAG: ATP-binding protein, partial [Chloroflexota bacterium]